MTTILLYLQFCMSGTWKNWLGGLFLVHVMSPGAAGLEDAFLR